MRAKHIMAHKLLRSMYVWISAPQLQPSNTDILPQGPQRPKHYFSIPLKHHQGPCISMFFPKSTTHHEDPKHMEGAVGIWSG